MAPTSKRVAPTTAAEEHLRKKVKRNNKKDEGDGVNPDVQMHDIPIDGPRRAPPDILSMRAYPISTVKRTHRGPSNARGGVAADQPGDLQTPAKPNASAPKPKGKKAANAKGDVQDKQKGKEKEAANFQDEYRGVPKKKGYKPRGQETAEEREAREEENAARRATRHQAAIDHPEIAIAQRKESGRARCDLVADVWSLLFSALIAREKAVQAAASESLPDRELIQAVVDAFCAAEGHLPIPPALVSAIPGRTIAFLAAVARNPTTVNIAPFVASGALRLSKQGEPGPVSACANYIRCLPVPKEKASESASRYLKEYPADTPFCVMQLLLQGRDLNKARKKFRREMEEYGLEAAVDVFFESVTKDEDALALHGTRRPTSKTSMFYNGITASTACADRGLDDVEAQADVRIINFLDSNQELIWCTYHLVDMDTRINDKMDVRTDPDISHKERVVRALFGSAALNLAPGGVQPVFQPSSHLLELQQRVRGLYEPLPNPLGTERDPRLEKRLEALIDDEVRLVGPLHKVKIVPRALDAVKANVAGVLRTLKGRVVTLHIAKDITLEGDERATP
ncbi:hypothetical protein MVEN_01918300 [Mycena venus]|uniref:Uncharacterized protein n=1 Tax=Mycena venus TaxID=2733690 RepID=A0A8H6XGD6_9AGAR|nr:hypothetical protein MVEN_01918300 [Mycena venus]